MHVVLIDAVGVELERRGARRTRRARAGRAAVGIGAARAPPAGAAAAAALALLLQVVWGGRDERAPRLAALARGVRVVRLAGKRRRRWLAPQPA